MQRRVLTAWKRGLLGLLLLLCAAAAAAAQVPLTILHTSEHHGAALPFDQGQEKGIGGFAMRATLVDQVRAGERHVLLVDTGDILIGTIMSSVFRGVPDVQAMNLLGYDALGVGSHEFDFGLAHLKTLAGQATFPFLATNITIPEGGVLRPHLVKRVGPLSVGIIGLNGREAYPDVFEPAVARQIAFTDPIAAAREAVRHLRGQVDLLIALTHQETREDLELLRAVPEIDVVIGGHTEGFGGIATAGSSLVAGREGQVPQTVPELYPTGPVFVKAPRLGAAVGRLDLRVQDKRVSWAKAQNLPIRGLPPRADVVGLLGKFSGELKAAQEKVLGQATVVLDGERANVRTRETNLGNYIADVLLAYTKTDVAVFNGGNIRASIPAGPVTLGHVLTTLPFDNRVMTFALTGAQLKAALENSVGKLPEASGRFLHVTGMRFSYDPKAPEGSRVRAVEVGGAPLDPARTYSITAHDFLAEGGDGFTVFKEGAQMRDLQVAPRDLVADALAKLGSIAPVVEGRIRVLP
ncbi:MAG: 5'-nucleotidase C-terminal domain-containing protein [candidate division NC10 bacterium]|nr:5'-nucleotidase C-terminal domain-containing protein [candidate division NC10 bacterium]